MDAATYGINPEHWRAMLALCHDHPLIRVAVDMIRFRAKPVDVLAQVLLCMAHELSSTRALAIRALERTTLTAVIPFNTPPKESEWHLQWCTCSRFTAAHFRSTRCAP